MRINWHVDIDIDNIVVVVDEVSLDVIRDVDSELVATVAAVDTTVSDVTAVECDDDVILC